MALQAGAEAPVGRDELGLVDHPDRPEHRIQQRGGVTLGEDQMVVGAQLRLVPVVTQVPHE